MRTLIVGAHRSEQRAIAASVLDAAVDYQVVSSFKQAEQFWRDMPNVKSVTCDWKNASAPDSDVRGLVLEVVAASFWTQEWVKHVLKDRDRLVVLCGNPNLLDTALVFDEVLMTKTTARTKLELFHPALPLKLTLDELCESMGKLVKGAAYSVGEDGRLTVRGGEPLPKTPRANVSNPDTALYRTLELELTVTPAQVPQARGELEKHTSNVLLRSMFKEGYFRVEGNTMRVQFHVRKQRQDLFVALMVNVLQALRDGSLIQEGRLRV